MATTKEVKTTPKKVKTEERSTKKSTKASSSKPKVSGLSEERVVDSDSEGEAPAVKPVLKSPKAVKEKEKKEKKPNTKIAPPPPPKEPTPSSDDEDNEESSASDEIDEEISIAPSPKKPSTVPVKVNGVKRKAESVSSLDNGESSGNESSDEDAKPDAKRIKTALKDAGEVEQVGEVAKNNDSESESSSEEEEEEEPSTDTAPAPRPVQHLNLESIPVQPFKPPNGYAEVKVTVVTFSANSFTGQQIWHIVAPSNISLKSIGDIALDAIPSGATVLTYKETKYSLSEDPSTNNQSFTVAVPSTNGYNVIPQPIARTLHVKQQVALPNLSKKQADPNAGSSAAADIAQPSVSDIRPQPRGMRMRYKPAGFGPGDPGLGSDSEEDDAQAKTNSSKLQFPKTIGVHGAAVEAKHAETSKTKKTKKKRRDSDVEMVNGGTPASAIKSEPVPDTNKPDVKDELSKEERKRLRAERRARKEAKAAKLAVAA